jgi:CheY-like chemotaxis protein/nitrogen-specific signal transduction histidine kinase
MDCPPTVSTDPDALPDKEEHLRKLVEELKGSQEALKEANRLKDRFLAGLSHELRTPLTPVLMAVAAMEANGDLPATARDDLALIRRNIELETRLIDDLLELSCIASGKFTLRTQQVDLMELLARARDSGQKLLAGTDVRIDFEPDSGLGQITADAARLEQILSNLIQNAVKFTPAGGRIVIGAQRGEEQVWISVRDTGVGMSGEVLGHISDALRRGELGITRPFGGLGLGLSICKALTELHRGKISAESDGPGKGSTFTIDLPTQDVAMGKSETDAGGTAVQTAKWRLLVVEDHADTVRMLGKLLGSAGYSVRTAGDAAAALDLASREQFDLVVSDIGLPDATGYQLMQEIKSRYGISGIAMSGYGMDEDVRKSREAGFSDHLVKPISFAQLDEAIHRLMNNGK